MAAREQRSAPTNLTSKSLIRSSSIRSSMGPVALGDPPGRDALLTRMCRPPRVSAAALMTRSTCSRLVASKDMGMARRPVVSTISAAVASRSGMEREPTTTSAPSRASSRAIALPMPRLAPPTNASLPSSPKSIVVASSDGERAARGGRFAGMGRLYSRLKIGGILRWQQVGICASLD